MAKDSERYILSSVDSALSVLNLFFDHETLNTTEIANLLGTNRSSIFRVIATLENRGYLTKDEHSYYRLGLKMFTLGQLAQSRMELNRLMHPYLERLAEETGETSHLIILEGRQAIFTDKVPGSYALKMDTPLGTAYPAHITGGGKAILAFKDTGFLEDYYSNGDFKKYTDKSVSSASALKKLIADVRKNGYAMDNEEAEIGLTCIAVPVLDERKEPIAAISVSGPTSRIMDAKSTILSSLTRVTEEIFVLLQD